MWYLIRVAQKKPSTNLGLVLHSFLQMGFAKIFWSRTLSEGKQGREQRADKAPSIKLSLMGFHGLHWMRWGYLLALQIMLSAMVCWEVVTVWWKTCRRRRFILLIHLAANGFFLLSLRFFIHPNILLSTWKIFIRMERHTRKLLPRRD